MSSSNTLNLVKYDEKFTSINDEVPGSKYVIDFKLVPDEIPKDWFNDDAYGLMVLRKVKHSISEKAFVCLKCEKQIKGTKETIFNNT